MEFAPTAVGAGEPEMPPTPGSGEMGQAIMGAQQAALFMEILESLRTRVKLLEQKVKDVEEEKYQNLRNETDQLKDIRDKCTPKQLVIAFVELIEKADKYFELEDYLKLHSDIKLYAMDHDPEVELQKMLKFIKMDLIPMLKKMMTLDHASTVFVCDVPPHASDDDIKESFSYYGDIISVEMQRLDEFQVAYVTYTDRKDAKLAVSVEKAKVCNQEVRVLSQRYYQAPTGSGYIPMVKPSKEKTEERFRNMREKALKKYKDLIKCHAELQVTDGKAASGGTDSIMKNDVANASTIPSICNAKHIEAGSSGGSVDEMSRSMSSMGFVEMEKMGQAQKFEVEKKMMMEAKREARRKKMEMEALIRFFRPGSSGGF